MRVARGDHSSYGSAGHVRPEKITYPNGRVLRYEYNSGADDALGRISFLADDDSGAVGTHLAEYTRLGLGTIVQVDYPEPQLRYDLAHGAGDDPYDGLDRFGRVKDLLWREYQNTGSQDIDSCSRGSGSGRNQDPIMASRGIGKGSGPTPAHQWDPPWSDFWQPWGVGDSKGSAPASWPS